MVNDETLVTVRERERELHFSKKSAVLFGNFAYTSNFIENQKGQKAFMEDRKSGLLK